MQFMIFILIFLAGLLGLEGLSMILRKRADPKRVRQRLREMGARVAHQQTPGSILRGANRVRMPSTDGLEKLLYRAGGSLTLTRFFLLTMLMGGAAFGALYLFTGSPVRALPGLLLGLLPYFNSRRAAKKRMHLFEEQLPEALELMTRSLRTGHALGAGFQMVGDELQDPIGPEFGLVAEEIRMGLDVREALENLMSRISNPDLPYFTTAVLIQRQTGGNLAELLDKLGRLLRERIQFSGRVRGLTAQGRGAATFLALWLPAILLILWAVSPLYLEPLLVNDWGHMVLAAAFAIDGLAYYMSLRISDVEA